MIYASFRIAGGFLLLALGLVGLLIPVLPTWPLFAFGLILLARHFGWARRLLHRVNQARHRASGLFARLLPKRSQRAPAAQVVPFPAKDVSPTDSLDRAA